MSECSFIGTIAPLQTAITIASDGGMRIKIDVPESEMGAALELLTMRGKTLRVTVEVANDDRETTNEYRKLHF